MVLRRHIKVALVKFLSLDSLQLWRYTLWKIGFVTSPEASQYTGVPGKIVITSSYRIQMKWDHFHWKEYRL
jgi:hypothetical protein